MALYVAPADRSQPEEDSQKPSSRNRRNRKSHDGCCFSCLLVLLAHSILVEQDNISMVLINLYTVSHVDPRGLLTYHMTSEGELEKPSEGAASKIKADTTKNNLAKGNTTENYNYRSAYTMMVG